MLDIQIYERELNDVTRAVMELPGMFARARASALKSLGYHIQQDLKREPIEPKLSPYTGTLARRKKKHIEPYKHPRYKTGAKKGQIKPRLSRRTMPFARLKNMVRYEVDTEDGLVAIGLLRAGSWTRMRMAKQAAGYSLMVTPKMRKMFFAVGLPLRADKRKLTVPARPWVRKVERRWQRRAAPLFEEKFWSALRRYQSGSG